MIGDPDSLKQHRGRAGTVEIMGEKKEYLSRREKERGKNPEKHLEAFSASNLKKEGLMPHVF